MDRLKFQDTEMIFFLKFRGMVTYRGVGAQQKLFLYKQSNKSSYIYSKIKSCFLKNFRELWEDFGNRY